MNALVLAGIAVAGGLGALGRFFVDRSVSRAVATSFPAGTFAVNLSGAFVLGVLAGATSDRETLHLAATGVLGSFTTFSTWALESQRLGEDGEPRLAAVNLLLSLALGVLLAWAGTKAGASF